MARHAALLLSLLVVGCEPDSDGPLLRVDNAWIRTPVADRTVTAGYCEITNTGPTPVAITGFTAEGLRVEIHETIDEGGMMRMRPVPRLHLAPGETASLAPGGKHLMLFDFDPNLESARIRATIDGGGGHWIVFEVRNEGWR
ncbi:MAG: copper chaperone PCu(A)C [Gammaproteobacteria bacterium]|nr:copper chaperone PCu(A)C [Gammaproteobacteria bacterium]